MTQKQINAMEAGKEMDTLVAEKVMGWKRGRVESFLPGIYCDAWVDEDDKKVAELHGFKPSTSIADAWMVIEKLKSMTIYNGNLHCNKEPWLTFCFHLEGTWGDKDGFNILLWEVNPLSICNAALKAVMT